MESSGLPLATGLASRRSLEDFDLLLASCSYHLELINLYYLLSRAGVPLRASNRESFPLLIVGGSSAMAAQGLIFPDGDCLADGLFFGEGEGEVQALVRILAAAARAAPEGAPGGSGRRAGLLAGRGPAARGDPGGLAASGPAA